MFEYRGTLRSAQGGPLLGLAAQVLLLAALAATVGLGLAGWLVGLACGLAMDAALAYNLLRNRSERIGPAGWVTLVRATLAVGVAALAADSFGSSAQTAPLVALAAVALVLDYVDGYVARRTGTESTLGARWDGEVDAFLILALAVYVAPTAGAWVLLIGVARYAFLVAGWLVGWMRAPLPRRDWRKMVAATQGVALVIAAAGVLPLALTRVGLAAALALLAESFGRDVWWLWSHRSAPGLQTAAAAERDAAGDAGHGRVRVAVSVVLTLLAFLLVWAALVAPDQPGHFTPRAFVRLPLEGVIVIALALVLPAPARRLLAWVVGPAIGLLIVVKVLDYGFFTAFDRPFNPGDDWSYRHIGIETLRESIGRTSANLVLVGAALAVVAAFVLPTLAMLRLNRVVSGHRRVSLQAVTALSMVWVLFWALGAQLVSGAHIASTSAADLAVTEVRTVQADIRDRALFAAELAPRPLWPHAGRPAADRPARQGRAARVRRELRPGRGAGIVLLPAGRQRARRRDEAAAVSGLRCPQRLADLVDVRRHQLAGALDDAVGALDRQPEPLRPARGEQSPDAQHRLQAGRVADRRRRAVGQPLLAGGGVVLPLRQGLQPAERRIPRPHLRLCLDARSVRLPGPAAARAGQDRPSAAVRRGRSGVKP